MLSVPLLDALRLAATLTHSLPGLRARLRSGDRVILEVRPPTGPEMSGPEMSRPREMSPCAFRAAVARNRALHPSAQDRSFLDLPLGHEPTIDIGVGSDRACFPGGIYRTPIGGADVWAFATTLDAETAFRLGMPIVDRALPIDGIQAMGIRPDEATGVSLAYVQSDPILRRRTEATTLDLLESLLSAWAVHQLTEPTPPAGQSAVLRSTSP
jgi:hypothetical protein